jgi:hypothetical protein
MRADRGAPQARRVVGQPVLVSPFGRLGTAGAHSPIQRLPLERVGRKDRAMHEPTILKRLLRRLLATRARRDREQRHTGPWNAADAELHAIERAIFRLPAEPLIDGETAGLPRRRRHRRPGGRLARRPRRRTAGRGAVDEAEPVAPGEPHLDEPS